MDREEAIRRIKAWNLDSDDREVLAVVIPELTDSDDERIREGMIDEIKAILRGEDLGFPPQDVLESRLAYLVKQKEQKPAEWDEDTKTNLDRALQIIKKAKGTLQGYQSDDGIYECDKAIECLEHFLYRGLEIEKSVEWSKDYREEAIQTRFAFYTYKYDSSVLYLSNVFVEEASRNHGFGSRILKAAEKVAETIGATTI